jgi:hypothetical protein
MQRLRDPFLTRLFIVAVVIIAMANGALRLMGTMTPGAKVPSTIYISPTRAQHILYGDGHGGGHLHGTGAPCKSEFPASWNADKILSTVRKDAANDNLNWHHERNGYDVTDVTEDGVKIRIVVNGQHSEIITAYPVNTPRNACSGAANDNGE